ncbi:MAG: hypothetical protein GYA55_09870, partial [SAR324 cluster bacterium]|nr:hypothetical protein [SAR324 cluster bacterium]
MAKTFTSKANQLVCAINSLALMLTLPSLVILCSPISGIAQDESIPIATSTPVGGEPLCNEEFEIPCVQWEEGVYLDEAKTVQALKMDEEGNFVFGCCSKSLYSAPSETDDC